MNTTRHIGHHEIDSQHAELDHIIDKAWAFCREANASTAGCAACSPSQQADCRRDVMALTRELLKFMVAHFCYEEQLMRSLPDNAVCGEHLTRHKRAHVDISAGVSALTVKLATSNPYVVAAELRRILTVWTGAHASSLDSSMVALYHQSDHHELDEDAERSNYWRNIA